MLCVVEAYEFIFYSKGVVINSASKQEVTLVKSGGPLGLSIVGGSDHASHPFGINEPGVFISKVPDTKELPVCFSIS